MTELYLIRHGQTDEAYTGCVIGVTDIELSATGQRNISALTSSLCLDSFHHCFSSDLERATESARLLGIESVAQDSRLRELNFGDWEGLSWQQAYEADAVFFDQWSRDWVNIAPPGGETFKDLVSRSSKWLDETIRYSDKQRILVTAHAGSIRALLCHALNIPLHIAMQFSIEHARIAKLTLSSQGNRCDFLNCDQFR